MRSKVCSTEKRHISLSHTVDPPRGFQRWEWNDGEGSGSGNLYNGSAPIWKTKQKQTRGAWACRRAGAQPRSPSRRTPSTVVTTRGGAARPGTLRCTCAHRYLSRGPIWGGETAKDVWAYFSNILGSEHVFPKHFPSEYLNPCVFRGKLDPHVSDSFTLNLSNCCFVRATWCPRSFMRVFFFFKPYLKQDVAYASAEDKMQKNVSLKLTWWPYRWVEARERRGVKKDLRLAGHKEHSSVIRIWTWGTHSHL